MRRSVLPFVLGGVAFATLFAAVGERDAHAARYYYAARDPYYGRGDQGVTLDVDADLALPIANSYVFRDTGKGSSTTVNPFNTGFGVDARLGFRARAGGAFVQPELVAGLQEFEWVNNRGIVETGTSVGRFMAGVRLGGRGIFEPQAYAHLGGAAGAQGISGFTYDVGGAANLHFRRVTFGIHASFNQIVGSTITPPTANNGHLTGQSVSIKWIDVGPNLGVIF